VGSKRKHLVQKKRSQGWRFEREVLPRKGEQRAATLTYCADKIWVSAVVPSTGGGLVIDPGEKEKWVLHRGGERGPKGKRKTPMGRKSAQLETRHAFGEGEEK